MNTQLENLLEVAEYYTPSETVDIPAGETKIIEFAGLNSQRYGFNRILVGGTGLSKIYCTVKKNNGRDTIIPRIQLETLKKLFLERSIEGAIGIAKGTNVQFVLENTGVATQKVNVELIGYDTEHLIRKIQAYESKNLPFPAVEFITTQITVPANTEQLRVDISMPEYETRLYRIAMSNDQQDEDILVSMMQNRTLIKDEVFLNQINEEFANMRIILPRTLKARDPFEIYLSNLSGNPVNVSFLGETYRI